MDSYFLGSWIFWVSFGSHLGPLEAFLRSLCSQKPLKNQVVFKGFWKWRFLVLWSSWWFFWAHLGPLGPLWSQTVFQNEFQHFLKSGKTNYVKDELKNKQKVSIKMGSRIGHFWDRQLKAFFTTEAFILIFFVIFLHGVLEVLGCLLGGSWASWGSHGRSLDPETLKIIRFFKVF